VYLLAAAGPWAAAMQAGTARPPIALVVVPLVALGKNQEDSLPVGPPCERPDLSDSQGAPRFIHTVMRSSIL